MLGRRTRNLLVKLVRALHAGTERLVLRLEAGDPRNQADAGEAGDVQDLAGTQLVKQGGGAPPAHWLEMVRRHAPQLLRPETGRRHTVTGWRERSELNAATGSGASTTPGGQPAPPAAARKTAAVARRATLTGPALPVRHRPVPPESGILAGSQYRCSATPEDARPRVLRAPRDRHSPADETAVHASKPAPRKEPVDYRARRARQQPSDPGVQLVQRRILRPVGGKVRKPPYRTNTREGSSGPAENPAAFIHSKRQVEPLHCAVAQKRETQMPSGERLEGARIVEYSKTATRETMQVTTQPLSQPERSGISTSAAVPQSVPLALGTSLAEPPPDSAEAVAHPRQAESAWPQLPDETDGDLQAGQSGIERWPNLPDQTWDPGARLSPAEALRAASEEQRKRLRLRRRDLEQRGERWSA